MISQLRTRPKVDWVIMLLGRGCGTGYPTCMSFFKHENIIAKHGIASLSIIHALLKDRALENL